MPISIREATRRDAPVIAELIRELAETDSEKTPITADYVKVYITYSNHLVLLAEADGQTLGLLSYSIHPNLYHANDCCLIEELIVRQAARGQGVGSMLVKEVMRRAESSRWAEVSVSTMPDNLSALQFYRKHGFGDEAVLLERHL